MEKQEPSASEGKGVRGGERMPRRVLVLGWVSFFADVSSEMAYPLMPLYVVGVLGASGTSLGTVEGVAAAIVAVLTFWAGRRSDRSGGSGAGPRRVPWIRWGYGLPVLGKGLIAVAAGWPMVLVGRSIDRMGKGLRTGPRDALIANATPVQLRGRAFGSHRAMDTAGALVGVMVAAVLLWWLTGSPSAGGGASEGADAWAFRLVFGVAAVVALISLVLTMLVRENAAEGRGGDVTLRDVGGVAGDDRLSKRYRRVLLVMLVFALARSSDAFLLLRASSLGLTPWEVVGAYAGFNVVYALSAYPAGLLSDRIGRVRVLAAGWGIFALVYAGFAVTGAWGVWPLMLAYGVYYALTEGVSKALIADCAPARRRGYALGLYAMLSGLAVLAASVAAGVLWDRVGPRAPFVLGASLAAAALMLTPLLGAAGRERSGKVVS